MKDDRARLLHLRDSIERIRSFAPRESVFFESPMVQDAVVRNLEIIGEAVKGLSQSAKDRYPDVPWRDIAAMRDRLIHHYYQVDLVLVWRTVSKDLETLGRAVDRLLST